MVCTEGGLHAWRKQYEGKRKLFSKRGSTFASCCCVAFDKRLVFAVSLLTAFLYTALGQLYNRHSITKIFPGASSEAASSSWLSSVLFPLCREIFRLERVSLSVAGASRITPLTCDRVGKHSKAC